MASEVDICNYALAHIGDAATVSSIDPPEGSAQADRCALFYPLARDELLELADFGFNTTVIDGANLTPPDEAWQYAYQFPNDALSIIAVLPRDIQSNYSVSALGYMNNDLSVATLGGFEGLYERTPLYTPQDFEVMIDATSGAKIIVTNQEDAKIRHTIRVTDAGVFPPLFVSTLSLLLASYLSGPIIKGDTGRKVGENLRGRAMEMLGAAQVRDAQSNRRSPQHSPAHLRRR